jgi:phage-related protein
VREQIVALGQQIHATNTDSIEELLSLTKKTFGGVGDIQEVGIYW